MIPLGRFTTVFQAEVFAILHRAETLIGEEKVNWCMTIFSDSQAALDAVRKPGISSILMWEYKKANGREKQNGPIMGPWTHRIRGNEKSDQLAKKDATGRPIGP